MIRVGDLYQGATAADVLQIESIRCSAHGIVLGARMVLEADPDGGFLLALGGQRWNGRMVLRCPNCPREVSLALIARPREQSDPPPKADLPMVPA